MDDKSRSFRLNNKLDTIAVEINNLYKEISEGSAEEDELRRKELSFLEVFKDLYNQSINDNYYWQFCPFNVYEIHYDELKRRFLDKYSDAKESDFVKVKIDELLKHSTTGESSVYISSTKKYVLLENLLDNEYLEKTKYSFIRKKEFLESKLKNIMDENEINEIKTMEDFIDNPGTEKIVFLYELGIVDFLLEIEPFNTSTNKLASIISKFTGIETKTVQSYLNPIINKSVNQRNNPLKGRTIKSVHNKLINIGVDSKKFKTKRTI